MAGITHDVRGSAAATPGDGRPRELGRILDREDNGYFRDVYLYTFDKDGVSLGRTNVGPTVRRITVASTSTQTGITNGTLILTGASTAQTIPVPAADGDRLLIINKNAGSNTVTAGSNKIYDDGVVDLNGIINRTPAAQTTVTLKGVGAFIELIGANSLWFTASSTLWRTGSDAVAVTFA